MPDNKLRMTLVCPMCSEALEVEGSHFYKHFKYKRYACGEQSCDQEFYTEAERNAHCSNHSHKRSFQKTVNPYIDKMIADLVFDAQELATKDMDAVIENRWGTRMVHGNRSTMKTSASTSCLETKKSSGAQKNKRSLIGTTPTSGAKKSKNSETPGSQNKSTVSADETPRRSNTNSVPSTSEVVDSTTNDQPTPVVEKPKQRRKRRTDSELNPPTSSSATDSIEKMSALDKLVGWFDQEAPERQEEARVGCALCGESIIYDFILRKGHATKNHLPADTDPSDYLEMLQTAMDNCFPEMPNSDLACQLCMKNTPIRKCMRREHIENQHTNSLIPLKCPECDVGYRRQCELASHMKESHKIMLSRCKNSEFQYIRRRRNFQISEMIKKCFPWSEVEKLEQLAAANVNISLDNKVEQMSTLNGDALKDVRILEAQKTRRAPLYNQNESDSDSDENPQLNEQEKDQSESEVPSSEDFSQDVIFIGQHFNSMIAEMLGQRNACIMVKSEPRTEDDLEVVRQELHVNLEGEEEIKREEELANSLPQPGLITDPELQSNYTPPVDTSIPPPSFIAPPEPYQNGGYAQSNYGESRHSRSFERRDSRGNGARPAFPREPNRYEHADRSRPRTSNYHYDRHRSYNSRDSHRNHRGSSYDRRHSRNDHY